MKKVNAMFNAIMIVLIISLLILSSRQAVAASIINTTGAIQGATFYGAGTGLTGTASGLAIGGNAATATALAANPADCAANTWATAIAASGALTCGAVTYAGITAATSANWASIITDESGTGVIAFTNSPVFTTPNIGSATGSISGNAGTATALAANGANCGAGNYPLGVDASGAVESCTAVDDTSVPKNHLANSGALGFTWSDAEVSDTLTASSVACTGVTGNGVGCSDVYVNTAGDTMSSNLTFSQVGAGMIGTYDPTKTQAIWAMGASYTLPIGGGTAATQGTLYGLGWSYEPDYGGAGNNPQSKAGLSHQLLVMINGVTYTAIGNGVWTAGNVNSNGGALQTAGVTRISNTGVGTLASGTTINGQTAWHAGNDGAGSGLDADTLDGSSSAAFYLASNPSGFITDGNTGWDNSYGYITDGNTNWDNSYGFFTTANDGAGSGLDADLLDGLSSAALQDKPTDWTCTLRTASAANCGGSPCVATATASCSGSEKAIAGGCQADIGFVDASLNTIGGPNIANRPTGQGWYCSGYSDSFNGMDAYVNCCA